MATPIRVGETPNRYFDSNHCDKGHSGWVYRSNRVCVDCQRIRLAAWRLSRKKPQRIPQTWEQELPKRVAYNREWRRRNPDLAASHSKKWREKNPGRVLARTRKRQAALMQRMPKWADQSAIGAIYEEAKRLQAETGIRYQVDHIVPLQGNLVSGLHVEYNLQLLTPTENRLKHNKWPV